MEFIDINDDSIDELLVGSNDYYIRAYKGEELIHEYKENAEIRQISKVSKNMFAFSLSNNAVGIYKGTQRIWRIKHKQCITAHLSINIDSADEQNKILVLAFGNGRMETRNCSDGVLLWKKIISEKVFAIQYIEIKGNGKSNVVCFSASGTIIGFSMSVEDTGPKEIESESDILLELYKQKQQYLNEISKLQVDTVQNKLPVSQLANIIPKNIKINSVISLDMISVHELLEKSAD